MSAAPATVLLLICTLPSLKLHAHIHIQHYTSMKFAPQKSLKVVRRQEGEKTQIAMVVNFHVILSYTVSYTDLIPFNIVLIIDG